MNVARAHSQDQIIQITALACPSAMRIPFLGLIWCRQAVLTSSARYTACTAVRYVRVSSGCSKIGQVVWSLMLQAEQSWGCAGGGVGQLAIQFFSSGRAKYYNKVPSVSGQVGPCGQPVLTHTQVRRGVGELQEKGEIRSSCSPVISD